MSPTTGLAVSRADSATARTSMPCPAAALAMTSAAPLGSTPMSAWAAASAASASSMACNHAASLSSASAAVPALTGDSSPVSR
ncbi:Uncharacterised protein [Mycobacteroides abscessus subsp. abscessus]|nr:Uncharacterised protein [Mycobacteroides abscessus]SIM15941.1 Uncharacterised protein [Mycobacteroides abscessus subsp. abscessus]SIN41998.1 Uncharacterised protein [Mycobacteroides abscessus subsp. bolletii]SLD11610.1 Uncharacterised protein [Mycobacteroides abscessus subsp. massiliense]